MIKAQVNLGRFLSIMGIEDVVLSDSVLPNQMIDERVSLIQGMLKGMLEKGDWQKALTLVYTPGPVKALFDGNWDLFHDAVIASAKNQKDQGMEKDLIMILVKNKSTDLVRKLIKEIPYNRNHLHELFCGIYDSIDETTRAGLNEIIGQRALEAKDFAEACTCFKDSGNTQAIDNIYATLLAKPLENIGLLLRIADADKEKITEIVKKVLASDVKAMQEIELDCAALETKLYVLINQNQIKLTDAELAKLRNAAAENMREYDVRKTGDNKLALLWAKKHHKQDPLDAYKIFIEQKYKGSEVLEAVKTIFSREYEKGLPGSSEQDVFKQLKEEHLRTIYPEQELWMRIKIAQYLGDKKKMCELSKETFEAGSFETSYHLWLRGKGELDCSHMDKLRKEIKEINKQKFGDSEFIFDRDDTVGRRMYYEEIIDSHPYTAYEIARNLEDEKLMQRARENLAAKKPEFALKRFMARYNGPDPKGANMCIEALAKKYSIPEEQVRHYVELGKTKF